MLKIRKLKVFWEYYKSLVVLDISMSLIWILFGLSIFQILIFFCSIGFVLSLQLLKLFRGKDYYFYYNAGVSKVQLLVFSTVLNLVFSIVILLVV